MPFTPDEFLDVFGAYNEALWPFAAALWVLTAVLCATVISRQSAPLPRLLLAGLWIWAGVMYHALFFTTINPAAWIFAALFVAQGVLLVTIRPSDGWPGDRPAPVRRAASSVLIVYSLGYPLLAWADGFFYPRMPTFGVPCPTVLLTIGFLLASTPSVLLSVIPLAWSLVGATAVWLFGVHADLALPVAGVVLVVDLIVRRSHAMRKLSVASLFVVLIAFVLMPATSVLAQATQHDHEQQVQKDGMKMDGMKMGDMKMNPKMMEEMAAKKKANTERITALMAKVKGASGDAKVAAMADLIGVLVDERAAMQEHCAAMMAAMKK